jgi:hypothetical protein
MGPRIASITAARSGDPGFGSWTSTAMAAHEDAERASISERMRFFISAGQIAVDLSK